MLDLCLVFGFVQCEALLRWAGLEVRSYMGSAGLPRECGYGYQLAVAIRGLVVCSFQHAWGYCGECLRDCGAALDVAGGFRYAPDFFNITPDSFMPMMFGCSASSITISEGMS